LLPILSIFIVLTVNVFRKYSSYLRLEYGLFDTIRFDERANGYARGEGASVLVLKHIEDAIRDGDTIRAVIRGSGVNQDGKTPGITLPSAQAQAALIRSTYQAAGLDFSETAYFEAHGTGTPAGDPLEIEAIRSTFGMINKDSDLPLYVGTVKPNIGHLEGCAGLAGILKTVLSLEAGVIPPNLNFEIPNPKLHLNESGLKIPTELTPWPHDGLRRASVNSFGYGGTNGHVILDDALHYLHLRGICGHTNTVTTNSTLPSSSASINMTASTPTTTSSTSNLDDIHLVKAPPPQQRMFIFSAPDQGAVERLMQAYSSFLTDAFEFGLSDETLGDLVYTLGNHRSIFQWRSAVIASSKKELLSQLASKAAKPNKAANPPKMVWIFTGQGAQWFAMGRELLVYDVYNYAILDADKYLTSIGADFSLYQELMASKEESRINNARISQPLCTALQIALVNLMRHWGLSPATVVGHSSGEIGAAYAMGALSAQDCLKVAFQRGRFSESIKSVAPHIRGSMMSVGLSEEEVIPYLESLEPSEIAIVACVNSPSNITLSGDTPTLEKLEGLLKEADVFARKLNVDIAYHSPHMKYVAEAYLDSIQVITVLEPLEGVIMYSSVTGLEILAPDLDPPYWVANMTSPVQFVKALNNVVFADRQYSRGFQSQPIDTVVEIGPHSALQGPLKQILISKGKYEGTRYLSMLHRGLDAALTSLETAAHLWSRGSNLNLLHLNSLGAKPAARKILPNLPLYPWNHLNRYWHSSAQENRRLFAKAPRLDWLGAPIEDFNPLAPCWKNRLRVSELPWLPHHSISNNIIFPGAGMICCALEAARQMADPSRVVETFELRDITIGRALLVPDSDRGVEILTCLKPRKTGMKQRDAPWFEYIFYSFQEDGNHIEHSSGLVKVEYKPHSVKEGDTENVAEYEDYKQDYQTALKECTVTISKEEFYTDCNARGIQFGMSPICPW
jgi:acyl transferase domain-containing protein